MKRIHVYLLILLAFLINWVIVFCPMDILHFIALIPIFTIIFHFSKKNNPSFLEIAVPFAMFSFIWFSMQAAWMYSFSEGTFWVSSIFQSSTFFILQLPTLFLVKKRTKPLHSMISFVCMWVLFECFCQYIPLATPFLILGFSLGKYPYLIQFYRLLGVEGGSVWILLVNLCFTLLIFNLNNQQVRLKRAVVALSVFIVPILLSLLLSNSMTTDRTAHVAIIHSYVEPTQEKYFQEPVNMVYYLKEIAGDGINEKAELVLLPETIFSNLGWKADLSQNAVFDSLVKVFSMKSSPQIVVGGNVFDVVKNVDDQQANEVPGSTNKFYLYNLAVSVQYDRGMQVRSKELFVPFQEKIPFVNTFPSLKNLVSVVGNKHYYSEDAYDKDIHQTTTGLKYSPLLCYEICFPLFVNQSNCDSDLLVVLGNEWWNSSAAGSQRYFRLLPTLAIQSGKPLLKCSNSGISCMIDAQGNILKRLDREQEGLLQGEIKVRSTPVFYSNIAGYSYIISLILLVLLVLFPGKVKI